MKCPSCENEFEGDPSFCENCGQPLTALADSEACGDFVVTTPEEAKKIESVVNPTMLVADTAYASHIGLVKQNNEDWLSVEKYDFETAGCLFIAAAVFDGMGGCPFGEVFARKAGKMVMTEIESVVPGFEDQQKPREVFFEELYKKSQKKLPVPAQRATLVVNQEVVERGILNGSTEVRPQFGATGAYLWLIINQYEKSCHLFGYCEGDVKIFLVTKKSVITLSKLHTVHGLPCRWFGASDRFAGFCFEQEIAYDEPFALVISTDGLWPLLNDEKLQEFFIDSPNAQALADALVGFSINPESGASLYDEVHDFNAGDDNTSVAVISVKDVKIC